MNFELTPELADQIIFSMENQEDDFVVHAESGDVLPVSETDPADESHYVPIPAWRSVDGYNLMERFVDSLRNPIMRERLRELLGSGRGVFRQFKNTVKERPEIERLWYRFKEREMRKVVLEWYNELRESWGLAPSSMELEEEPGELVLTDFAIAGDEPQTVAARAGRYVELDREAFDELFREQPEGIADFFYRRYRPEGRVLIDERSVVLSVETPSGELAGFLLARDETLSDGMLLCVIQQIYVDPEYRGLGLAKLLTERALTSAFERGAERALIDLPGSAARLRGYLVRESFAEISATLEIDLGAWHRSNIVSG